jgi:hypothetical protein
MLFPSSMMNVVLEDTDSNHMIFSWWISSLGI